MKLVFDIYFIYKALLALTKDVAQMMNQVPEINDGPSTREKTSLMELFQSVRNDKTLNIVERIVNDIDGAV